MGSISHLVPALWKGWWAVAFVVVFCSRLVRFSGHIQQALGVALPSSEAIGIQQVIEDWRFVALLGGSGDSGELPPALLDIAGSWWGPSRGSLRLGGAALPALGVLASCILAGKQCPIPQVLTHLAPFAFLVERYPFPSGAQHHWFN